MDFGFVPSQVVKELEEIGNWKVLVATLSAAFLTQMILSSKTSQGTSPHPQKYTLKCILLCCSQARSAAVDKLYSALQKVQDKDILLPTLSKLLRFLAILGEDTNFKISLSTMQILADLTLKLGQDIRPYLG